VHEKVIVTGPYGQLQEPLIHETFASFEEVIDKMNRYSSAGARLLHEQGKRGGLGAAIGHSLWAFIRTYFLKAGLLDGREGLMLAISGLSPQTPGRSATDHALKAIAIFRYRFCILGTQRTTPVER
jgi:hypothetical protein